MSEDSAAIDNAVRLHAEAVEALERGSHDAAFRLASESLGLFEQESGSVHPDVANVLVCLARTEERRARFREASDHARRAVGIMREVCRLANGADIDRLLVQTLTAQGDLERILGRYEAAEPLLREALAAGEQSLGNADDDYVAALNSLGVLFKYSGRFDEARALYERAIDITERAGGKDHPSLATLFHNLGGLEHARGDYARAEPPARRAVELRKRELGPDHPVVAADVAALAAIVDARGRHREAEAMYLRALDVFERVYGPDHYEVAVTLNNLAAVCEAENRREEAERHYRRALALKQTLFGSHHPDVAMTQNNLSTFVAALDAGHPKIQACAENYASLLRDQGRPTAAGTLIERYKVKTAGR
jgi:tetratricopeptide (TPR) repeat protein